MGTFVQQDRLLQLAGRDDDERWSYEMTCNPAHVQSALLNAESDVRCEDPIGTVETAVSGLTRVGNHSKYGF